jgi:hypothetical protein
MRGQFTIQLKALFLLVVFSMNSLLGFACSIGLDLGYNRGHHAQAPVKASQKNEAQHDCEAGAAGSSENNTSPVNSHDCCKDGVLKLNLSDKTVSAAIKMDAPSQTALTIVTLYLLQPWSISDIVSNHYYVRSDHPPISKDIRISIQSFQI